MTSDRQHILHCPSCHFRYRIPEAFLGRSLSCKQCGATFILKTQADDQMQPMAGTGEESKKVQDILRNDRQLVIGNLAVKYNLASRDQILEAIRTQEKLHTKGEEIPLGRILVLQGVIDEHQLRFLLSLQQLLALRESDQKFGHIAVLNQFASQDQIDQALAKQNRIFKEKGDAVSIGDILVGAGILSEQQRKAILARQDAPCEMPPESDTTTDEATKKAQGITPFQLTVSDDRLTATITPLDTTPASVTLEDIKAFLKSKRISFGILEDARIQDYLNTSFSEKETFRVAQGSPPVPPRDQEIRYFFDTNPLKAGMVREDGYIDFKDRGVIPKVQEGDILAEILPAKEGAPGKDVFGRTIPVAKPSKSPLRLARGTKQSVDGLRVLAVSSGRPVLSADGKLSVLSELEIHGDVDLKTGHVDFEGDIIVTGTVQNGFRVKGAGLSAKEILRAEVETIGDIVVSGGIIGAQIKAGGGVKAKFTRDAHIDALGDVIIDREILDSRIETSGTAILNEGVILSSQVAAKKGIRAGQIGSEKTRPCTLIVGLDTRIKKEIDALRQDSALKEKEVHGCLYRMERLKGESAKLQQDIGLLAQDQDRTMVKQRQLREKRQELEAQGDKVPLDRIDAALQAMDSEIADREKEIEALFDAQDRVSQEIKEIQEKSAPYEQEIREIEEKISELNAKSQAEKGIPEVRVTGPIFRYTIIKGCNASLTLPEEQEDILIKEVKTRSEGDKVEWKIRLTRPNV